MLKITKIKPKMVFTLPGVKLEVDFEFDSKQRNVFSADAQALLYEIIAHGRCGNPALDRVGTPSTDCRGITLFPPMGNQKGYLPYLYENGRVNPSFLGVVAWAKLTNAIEQLVKAELLQKVDGAPGTTAYILASELEENG